MRTFGTTHTNTHTHARTHIHTRTRTHIHTHTHTPLYGYRMAMGDMESINQLMNQQAQVCLLFVCVVCVPVCGGARVYACTNT